MIEKQRRSRSGLSRREWLRTSAAAASIGAAHAALPVWMPRLAFAPQDTVPRGDVLVSIFLRGGADGLNMIVPHGDADYYAARPSIGIPRPDALSGLRSLDLDGFFGIHPALATLYPIFLGGQLTAIHASGVMHGTRSHFEAMDYVERGTSSDMNVSTGWIGRHLSTLDTGNMSPIRAVGWGTAIPSALRGAPMPLVLQSIADYHLNGNAQLAAQMMVSLERLYALDGSLVESAQATQSAVELLARVSYSTYVPSSGAVYPDTDFARALRQTAALIRADVGLEAACIDLGGWDNHVGQGGLEGKHARQMGELAHGLSAFHTDMGPDMRHVTVVVMSEFGRRVAQNAGDGTDHGHGGLMFVMSGNLSHGPVFARWPGLAPDVLYQGEDLAITTDYRDILTELLSARLNNPNTAEVFPDYTPQPIGLFG